MLKYVIFDDGSGIPYPVIFNSFESHLNIAQKFPEYKILSAGKISKGFNCVNGSVTLGRKFDLKQSAQDTETINKLADLD